VALARRIEAAIGRPLEVVSGGATTSLPLLLRGGMPSGVTELRIGEAMLCAGDLPRYHGVSVPGVRIDAFTLRAEIIEVRAKPSLPVGERFIDAFGERPVYEDRGTRMHLLLGIGKRDFGSHGYLVPRDHRIHVTGSSSDHLICEADEPCGDLRYGTVLEFDIMYAAMLFLCDGNPYINVEFKRG
jgi:predicted amino acid racemase